MSTTTTIRQTTRFFNELGLDLGAAVFLNGTNQHLEISEDGIIQIPAGVRPNQFKLTLLVPKADTRTFINQKEVSEEQGEYRGMMRTGRSNGDFNQYTMRLPIQVKRARNQEGPGEIVWVNWHGKPGEKPNRVDCWQISNDGEVRLSQVGIFTHDNGQTFRLHCEDRYRGRLYLSDNGYVVAPRTQDRDVWGPFTTWKDILNYPRFKALAQTAHLSQWDGTPEELEPKLQVVTEPGFAVVKFYIPFGGFAGWGIAIKDSEDIAVLGPDILEPEETDGVKRLRRNDVVSFDGEGVYGERSAPKLLNVSKVA